MELGKLDIEVDSGLAFIRERLTSNWFSKVILIYAQSGTAVSAGMSFGNLKIGRLKQCEGRGIRI